MNGVLSRFCFRRPLNAFLLTENHLLPSILIIPLTANETRMPPSGLAKHNQKKKSGWNPKEKWTTALKRKHSTVADVSCAADDTV